MMTLSLVRNYLRLRGGLGRRLGHRGLCVAFVRPGRHARRHGGRRPDRSRRTTPAGAVSTSSCTTRPPPPAESIERELNLTSTRTPRAWSRTATCHHQRAAAPGDEGLFGDKLIGTMKRGAYLINTARAKIADRDAIDRALRSASSQVRGRRVVPQPARRTTVGTMPTTHDPAHLRVVALGPGPGTPRHPEILESWFAGRRIREEYLIVDTEHSRLGRPLLLDEGLNIRNRARPAPGPSGPALARGLCPSVRRAHAQPYDESSPRRTSYRRARVDSRLGAAQSGYRPVTQGNRSVTEITEMWA